MSHADVPCKPALTRDIVTHQWRFFQVALLHAPLAQVVTCSDLMPRTTIPIHTPHACLLSCKPAAALLSHAYHTPVPFNPSTSAGQTGAPNILCFQVHHHAPIHSLTWLWLVAESIHQYSSDIPACTSNLHTIFAKWQFIDRIFWIGLSLFDWSLRPIAPTWQGLGLVGATACRWIACATTR